MSSVIGRTVQQAESELLAQGYITRVVQVDGQSFPMTAEFMLNRMNLVVENGVVVRAYVG